MKNISENGVFLLLTEEEPLPHGGLARRKSLTVAPAVVQALAALDKQLPALVRRLGTKQAHLIIWLKKLFLKQVGTRTYAHTLTHSNGANGLIS